MQPVDVLAVVEHLLRAAEHPDIVAVQRYGPLPGVAVTYQSGAKAFLWPVMQPVGIRPVGFPAELPEYRFRAQHALKLLADLLAVAGPPGWVWRTVAIDDVQLAPCALEIAVGGRQLVLRVSSAGAPGEDSDPRQWAEYEIPAGLMSGS